jgi:hypothetical protein
VVKKIINEEGWKFFRDCRREWRWEKAGYDGNVVGTSSEGFKTKADCEADARKAGWHA